MLSASVGRDSCQRISADSSNANSVNLRNKAACAAIIFFLTKSRPDGERAENGLNRRKRRQQRFSRSVLCSVRLLLFKNPLFASIRVICGPRSFPVPCRASFCANISPRISRIPRMKDPAFGPDSEFRLSVSSVQSVVQSSAVAAVRFHGPGFLPTHFRRTHQTPTP